MTEIRCRELVGAYAVGALEPPEAAVLADHLLTCTRCRHVLAEAEETAALLAAVPPEMFLDEPADLNDPILRRTLQAIRVEAAAPPSAATNARRDTVPIPSMRPPARQTPTTPSGAPQQGFPGWSGQTARSHRRRPQAITGTEQRRRYKLIGAAAAAVLILGGGVALGAQLTGDPGSAGPPAPAAQTRKSAPDAAPKYPFEGNNAATNVTAQVTVEDLGGSVQLTGTVSGLQAGLKVKLAVRDSVGVESPIGEPWTVTLAANEPFSASADIDFEKLGAVEVLSSDGQMLVTAYPEKSK